MIGEKKPVDRAHTLTKFIIDHQIEIRELDNENNKLLKNIESRRNKVRGELVEEVLVPRDLLGIIIGKAGANIAFVKQEYGVGIHILECDTEDYKEYTDIEIPEDKALLRIYGNEKEWVLEAKNYIQFKKVSYPIEEEKIEYVKGYQNSIINDIKEKSGCVKIFVRDPIQGTHQGTIEAIGNEEALVKLNIILDTHMEYYDTHQDKIGQQRVLSKQQSKYNSYGDVFHGKEGANKRGGKGRGGAARRN
mmetsp:Transcript_17278/g.19313  ORF Transcript_17278/g.19313 Transcript_17278/m.19313 type:complete len:248 (+) Transcript_17278:470-1213(+)